LIGLDGEAVASVVRECCRAEVMALKPGNVSIHAGGHGMTADDFLASADAIAPIMGEPGLTVGARILAAVEATVAVAACNTNLGIVLLLAPLAQAVFRDTAPGSLRDRLARTLKALDRADAVAAYQAIRLANPGGLGQSAEADVAAEPAITLIEAMRIAAGRDRIAYQYAYAYSDIWETGIPSLRAAQQRLGTGEWATTECYLRFLSAIPDSHIERKQGREVARAVQTAAAAVETRFKACENPSTAVPLLLSFDEELKRGGLNPGTSADLTVATLAAVRLGNLLDDAIQRARHVLLP
jgi:triphosphoribosyl-dephospho-CoA synthase